MFNGEYLGLDLEAEVGVEVTQLHLVVQQHGVVAVLRRVCSLEGARKTKKQEIKRVFITQSPPAVRRHTTERGYDISELGRSPARFSAL